MAIQAQVRAVLEDEAQSGDEHGTLALELDAIPGAVWQTELASLMPHDVRVSLFERGTQKCALLRFPAGQKQRALEAFEAARQAANLVSEQAHRAAQTARQLRESAAPEPDSGLPPRLG
jgi:hypothetical protein